MRHWCPSNVGEPLSCVPPMMSFGSFGSTASAWNSSTFSPEFIAMI